MCKDNIGVPLNASTQPYLGKDWERGCYAIAVKHNRPEELRCLYLLSYVKREFGDDLWKFARWQLSYQGFGSEVPSRSIAEAIIVSHSQAYPSSIPSFCPGEQFPEMLNDVIRGHWSIDWNEVGNVKRLTALLPMAFPPLSDSF